MKITYEDPTGGGDDITMEVPDWVSATPIRLHVTDTSHEQHVFEKVYD